MKSLIRKIYESNKIIFFRNSFKIKPVYSKTRFFKKEYPFSMSDAFLWRTDNNFKTKFKYADILKLFYNIKNSYVEFHFYSRKNELIKIKKVGNLNISNELDINSLNLAKNDYGVFYIYHFVSENFKLNENIEICNQCYLGYSYNNKLYSFVHGNVLAKYSPINSVKPKIADTVPISLFCNQKYTIQKYFKFYDKVELFFVNPTSKNIKFRINNNKYFLKPGCSKIIEVFDDIITIVSNCLFLRPMIFTYKNNFLDVHHS